MKKITYMIATIVSFVFWSLNVSASKVVVITGDDVRFRDRPSTNSNILNSFNRNTELTLVNENGGTGNGCNGTWYQANYYGTVGYICSEFAVIKEVADTEISSDDYSDYQQYLRNLGFPDSYIPYLVSLHNSHPDWQFKVYRTNLDFNYLLNIEYDGYYRGWSLIEDTGRYFDGYKSTDSWSYNYLTDVFNHSYSGGGSNWYAANREVIAYYMDPRNFLNERQVFMFETLSYNSTYHTASGIEAMLRNTFMTGYANQEKTKTYVDAFMDAAKKYNVSPYVLVSRVIQEVGANGSTIVSGTVSGYEGYYNFYNIRATGAQSQIIINGLKYAKEQGWNSPYKAIVGGASFLADSYINAGQDTLYSQKWDLIEPNPGRHQYMQNIQAPSTESIKTYNGYNNAGLVNSHFVFSIPIFNNVPNKTNLPSSASPNNYLSSLSVNGNYLFQSATNETNFNLVVDSNVTSVDIAASKVNASASINGTGSVAVPDATNNLEIIVTAGNGKQRTYTITITKRDEGNAIALDISEILRTLNITNDGTYIHGLALNSEVTTFIARITEKEPLASVTYTDKDNKSKTSGIMASGDKLTITTSREEKTYTIVIYGDVNSDGKITSADYIAIKNHIMDIKKLSTLEQIYADASRDNKVSSADYIAIKNHIMDIKRITQ